MLQPEKSYVLLANNAPQQSSRSFDRLDELVSVNDDGHVVFTHTAFDFSSMNSTAFSIGLVQQLEKRSLSAWAIAEAAFLNERYDQHAEALALYTKALSVLQACYSTISTTVQ